MNSFTAAIHPSQKPLAGFSYAPSFFQQLAHQALAHAKKLGSTDAAVEVSEGTGLSVSTRLLALENLERHRDKSLSITVYIGKKRGGASTSDFSDDALAQTVQAAYDIAKFTGEDDSSGLPEPQDYARFAKGQVPDLDLFHPWAITSDEALVLARRIEDAALKTSKRIQNSEGASVSAQQSHFWMAHLRGAEIAFEGGYASSRHSLSVAPIAGKGEHMQRDDWYSSMRNAAFLASPERLGRYAAERALARLYPQKLSTRTCPVLLESPLAVGLLGSIVHALSGGSQYRKTTFLLDSLGERILPSDITMIDDPFERGTQGGGKGSAPFDEEGVQTQARHVIEGGVVQGYFLSSYSARKLGMKSTGNAGGSHNLTLTSSKTQADWDLAGLFKRMGRGLFVTELMGQGVNYVTGDYSRGASGYWIENGEIAYPVAEVTIAGNLKDMLLGIEAVGADAYNYGAKTTGTILINQMRVAGC